MPISRARFVAAAACAALVLGVSPLPTQTATAASLNPSPEIPADAAAALAAEYPAPYNAIFVATNGSDANDGSLEAPYATLAKAMKVVTPGRTIVFRGGVYRQGASAATGANIGGTYYFTNIPAGVTLQSYPGETVWFDGTKRVTSWKKISRTHYRASWVTPDFCAQKYYQTHPTLQANDGPCSYPDSIAGSTLGDPQMLFRNGKQLTQVSSRSKVTSNSKFYYDWKNRTLHVRFKPSASNVVEATQYAQAMALYKPNDFSIKGIGFRRYATNQIHNATAGAVLLNLGKNVLVENSVFIENAGNGLQSWQTANLTIRRSVLSSNGANGLNYDGNWRARNGGATPADDILIEYSRLDGNNTDRYGVNCTWSCGAAGAKLTGSYGMVVRYNSFSRNAGGRGTGFWCDLGCTDLKAYGNVFFNNDRHGLLYEISDEAIIASNIFADNGWDSPAHGGGYALYVGSANVRIYNNTLANNQRGVGIYDDERSPEADTGGFAAERIGPSTTGVEFVNNIVTGGNPNGGRHLVITGATTAAGNTVASELIEKMGSNSYHRPADGPEHWASWYEGLKSGTSFYKSIAAFHSAHGLDQTSEISTASRDPYLVNAVAGDFGVREGSGADGTAADLPADIARMLDVATSGHDRGAISLIR